MNKFLFTIPLNLTKVDIIISSSDIDSAIAKFSMVFGEGFIIRVESIKKI